MTEETGWWDDDRLLAELAAAVRDAQDVPESFVRAGKAAYAWRTVDAELARLLSDAPLDAGREPAGLRGGPADHGSRPRALTFAASGLSIDLEIHPDAVRGQLVPPQAAVLLVRDDADRVQEVTVDDVGWFVVAPVPARRFRLHVRTAAGASVRTDWIDV